MDFAIEQYIMSVVDYPVYSKVFTRVSQIEDEFVKVDFRPKGAYAQILVRYVMLGISADANLAIILFSPIGDENYSYTATNERTDIFEKVPVWQLFTNRINIRTSGGGGEAQLQGFVVHYQLIYNDKELWQQIHSK